VNVDDLWNQYQLTGLENDLEIYNAARRQRGLDLYRPPGYVRDWGRRLLDLVNDLKLKSCNNIWRSIDLTRNSLQPTSMESLSLLARQGRGWQQKRVFYTFNNIRFCLFIGFYSARPATIYPYNHLRIMFQIPGPEAQSPPPPLAVYKVVDLVDARAQEVEEVRGPDISEITAGDSVTPWASNHANKFLNVEELLLDTAQQAATLYQDYYQSRITDLKQNSSEFNFRMYLNIAKFWKQDHYNKNKSIFQDVFRQRWFGDKLLAYSKAAEKFLEKNGLQYDLEQTWPVKTQGFELSITTGYRDKPSTDNDDEDYGEERRYAGEEGDRFATMLDNFDASIKMIDKNSWAGDYEIEERDANEVAFEVRAERPLSLKYLEMLINNFP